MGGVIRKKLIGLRTRVDSKVTKRNDKILFFCNKLKLKNTQF